MIITPHPLVPVPDDDVLIALHEQQGPEAVQKLLEAREERIRKAEEDPVNHGFMLPQQDMIEELLASRTECWIYGGNRSGKSFTSARIVMKALLENPGTTIICWAQNEEASIEMQQPYLQAMLPANLRGGRVKESVANINWNDKSGFTGKKFVLPNGSKCLFKFYSQFIGNPKVIEGFRLGCPPDKCQYLNIGTWLDEYYMDEALIKRLYRRCNDYDAKIITSFTPLDGYTPTVKTTLSGAKILKTQYASLLKREMPYVMQPKKKSSAVVFFHTERNPFTNFKRLSDDLEGNSEEEIMTIAYGYPTKSITTNFPLFNEDVHVVKELPTIKKETHTVYQVIDPSDARNFFCLWAAVDKIGRVTILREWPDRDTYGEWAQTGSGGKDGVKWKPGPASKKLGYSILAKEAENSYPELFKSIEKELNVDVWSRIGDCRYMAAEHGEQDMFADFADKDMWVEASWGGKEKDGLRKVEDWFSYDPNVPVDSMNRPRLTIHKSCGNLIDSIINYAPEEGKAYEALKDPIDCLRYLRTTADGDGPQFYDTQEIEQKESSWGY